MVPDNPEEVLRLMEAGRKKGFMELESDGEGEIRGKLTEAGEAKAKEIWRELLEVGDEVDDDELDVLIAKAGDELFGKRSDAE